MKLYEISKGRYFKLLYKPNTPPGGLQADEGLVLYLHNIDGMYSYCVDQRGQVYHIAAYSDVEILPQQDWEPASKFVNPGKYRGEK